MQCVSGQWFFGTTSFLLSRIKQPSCSVAKHAIRETYASMLPVSIECTVSILASARRSRVRTIIIKKIFEFFAVLKLLFNSPIISNTNLTFGRNLAECFLIQGHANNQNWMFKQTKNVFMDFTIVYLKKTLFIYICLIGRAV